ncbi:MAG: hypothetical protein FJX75_23285 [Armatimonadetes bacterium]|nr:hypothetical protein [Armatimonadota bacterium]
MRRLTLMTAAAVGTLALLATTATAQGWGRGRMANLSAEDQQKVTNLHQKVRQAQWDLWNLQDQNADAKKIEQKRAEVLRLHGELAKLMTDLPAGPCFRSGAGAPPANVGAGGGLGRGPCGMGLGFGRGGGRGMGYGRGGGWGARGGCPYWQR